MKLDADHVSRCATGARAVDESGGQVVPRDCTCPVSPLGGAGTVLEGWEQFGRGGRDEEEEQLVSVQIVATFSLFHVKRSRCIDSEWIVSDWTPVNPVLRVSTESGLGTGPKRTADHGSGGRADLDPLNSVSVKILALPPR